MKYSGQDAGGMEKEWFTLLTEEFLDPDTGNPILLTNRSLQRN